MKEAITLRSETLEALVLCRGATLSRLRCTRTGRDLVLGFADPSHHADIPIYAGAIVGPVANRIAGGVVRIDGTAHQMPLNENGRTALHSGPDGTHNRLWRIAEHASQHVSLTLMLEDGAQGLPGARTLTATYRLDGQVLTLELTARTDALTPMNLAHHPYWQLDGAADICGHQLELWADRMLPTDAESLPTGAVLPLRGTEFDFQQPRDVPRTPALDLNFCLHGGALPRPVPAARLKGATGMTLELSTNAPGLQVYGGAHLPELPGVLHGGADLAPYAGIALEPQFWPDAPRHPVFPSILLPPDRLWRQVTQYRIIPGA